MSTSTPARSTLTLRAALMIVTVVAATVLAACSSTPATPNLVGSWSGDYTYPQVGGGAVQTSMTLTITKQDGLLLYGYEEWGDGTTTLRADVVGSLSADSPTFVLALSGGFFSGAVDGNTMVVRFVRSVEGSSTSFETRLTKQ